MSAAVSSPRSLAEIAPFRRSPESQSVLPTTVRGDLPTWLRGQLVRTCPAVFDAADWRAAHWFDGLGMIYAFEVDDDSVTFHSRLLDSEVARDALQGWTRMGTFGTKMSRSLWQRIFEPIPRISDNTNVNILKMGGELVAMTEGNRQLVIDEATLAPVKGVNYLDDDLGIRAIMSAHPHYDFDRGCVVNVATMLGASATLAIYEHAPNARRRMIVGSWRAKELHYVHSFGLTPASAILVAHPFSARPSGMLWSNRGFIEHFGWHPEQGTRLVVIDRATGATREHVTDPFFIFHTVNAFEEDGETVLDLLAYSSADIVGALKVERMLEELPDLRPSLVRIRMKPGRERATMENIGDVGFEFPATNYRRVNGHGYRFVWGASDGPRAGDSFGSSIVKIDVTTGASTSYSDDDTVFGEPVFVARPGASSEDDGVLVTVGSRKSADVSVLAVLDAKTLAFVASAEVPRAIPLGFHGSFVRKDC